MNNTLSKVEKENPSRRVPSPDGVVAYHAALSRLRPGFKSRSGRHTESLTALGRAYPCLERAKSQGAAVVPLHFEVDRWWVWMQGGYDFYDFLGSFFNFGFGDN